MCEINSNYLKLPGSYLFAGIKRRVDAYRAAHPDAKIISLGIGDVTRPLVPAVIEAMHAAVDEMADASTFRGYGPEQGYDFLIDAIIRGEYTARGIETTPIGFHGAVLFSSVWDLDKALAGKLPRALRKHLDQWNASTEDLGGIAPTSKITTFVPTFVAYNARVEPVNRQSKALLSRLRSIGIPIWEYCASYRNPPLNWQLDGSELSELLNRDVDAFVEQITEGRPSPKYIEI